MLLKSIPSHFKRRREALMQAHPGAAFLIPAAEEVIRNNDVSHAFRQDSSFYYFTGYDEPEAFCVIQPAGSKAGASKLILFVREKNPEKEMWEGERYGTEGARSVFGADEAYPLSELSLKLPELLKGMNALYFRLGQSASMDRLILSAIESLRQSAGRSGKGLLPLMDPTEFFGEMRLRKTPDEVEALRKACQVTALTHKKAMQTVRPGMNEFEVEAMVDYGFRQGGCKRLGYGSIVAGGMNATCLHYRANNEVLQAGDLLLIDAGGEYDYYTSDITRTFPISAEFTKEQAQVYDLVLKSQKAALAAARPGAKFLDPHHKACEVLVDGMLSLGLLQGDPASILKENKHRRFYPHNTGHWLGMDVHDAGLYQVNGESRILEPGMVFTVEPGFYVQPSDRQAPAAFQRIGIRIEDDVLITANGHEVLTAEAPKERDEIQSLRAQALQA